MGQFNMNIGSIDWTIDDEKAMVSYSADGYAYEIECGRFSQDVYARQIVVYPILYKTVNGKRDYDSRKELNPPLRFDNNTFNKLGLPLYDSFFAMTNLSGIKIMRALVNTYLESSHFVGISGMKAPCFDPLNDWTFKHPIEFSLASTGVTSESGNDGTITATVIKPDTGTFQIRYFDSEGVIVQDFISGTSLSGVESGVYQVQLKNMDTALESNKVTIEVQPFIAV